MKKGFTLIELLVVIAIIAILSAIIFPVFARAKISAYKSADMSNMNAIRTAMQLYKADQEAYPPSLLGFATPYGGSTVLPANQVVGALYPKRIDSVEIFRPALDRPTIPAVNQFTTAVWPQGVAPQRFGPSDPPVQVCFNGSSIPQQYYTISGYVVATVPTKTGTPQFQTELRYSLFWSNRTVALDPCNPVATGPNSEMGDANDAKNQLGYSNPPDTTVVTWDSFFREPYQNGVIPHGKGEVVLFLAGNARPYDSQTVAAQAWQVTP